MAFPIAIPIILAALGGLGSGISAFGQSQRDRAAAEAMQEREDNLSAFIDEINSFTDRMQRSDTTSSRLDQLSRALNASSGALSGSGLANSQVASAGAKLIIDDQGRRDQVEQQNLAMIGQLLQDPAFGSTNPEDINIFGNTLLGGLSGIAGGAASGLGSFLGTPAGLESLLAAFGGGSASGGGLPGKTMDIIPTGVQESRTPPKPFNPYDYRIQP